MTTAQYLKNLLIGAIAATFVAAPFFPSANQNGRVFDAAVTFMVPAAPSRAQADAAAPPSEAEISLNLLGALVAPLSHPKALEEAFHGYFAFKAAHPGEVRKPFLYFVDYGLPSTKPRGYLFDMASNTIVEGPFMVAHGRGSSAGRTGVPTRFSNRMGSGATSLGLYLAQGTYSFSGKTGGRNYGSIGLRLAGLSRGYNDNAHARGVVAHGAPYVTATTAGRSEGCPAMEPSRAARILPKLANGGMVFLFAPREDWMASDPWIAAGEKRVASSAGAD